MASAGEIDRLIELLEPTHLIQLRATLQERAVQHARDALSKDDTNETRTAPATSLNSLAFTLCQLGRHDEELGLRAETTVRWKNLSQLDPDQHNVTYQRARDRLAASYSEQGREPDAAWRAEKDLAHRLAPELSPPERST